MKKYVWTLLGTAAVLCSVLLADYTLNKDFAVVQTMQVQNETVQRYVTASGTIHETDKRDIYTTLPFKMARVHVAVGDRVKTGQKLGYLDKASFLNELNLAIIKGDTGVSATAAHPDLQSMKDTVEATDEAVISPIDGIVTAVNCFENGRVNTDVPLFSVSNLESFYIKTKVPENKAKDIRLHQTVLIEAAGLHQQYEGRVESIAPAAQTGQLLKAASPSIEVSVRLNEVSEEMKPGMTADLKFLTTVRPDAIVIPFDAVQEDEGGSYVYLNRSGYAKKQYVTLGEEFETRVEVLQGISSEDKLILQPRQNGIVHGKKIDEILDEST